MNITITLNTSNAAFHNEDDQDTTQQDYETARILKELATTIEQGSYPTYLQDYNGNTVGEVKYTNDN